MKVPRRRQAAERSSCTVIPKLLAVNQALCDVALVAMVEVGGAEIGVIRLSG